MKAEKKDAVKGEVFFDLDDEEGTWFQYFGSHVDEKSGEIVYEDPVDYARARIRNDGVFLEERVKKQKRSRELVLNPKTRQMEMVSYFEEQPMEKLMAESDDLYDYAITGLEGFKNRKTGEVLECTRKDKIALRRNGAFRRFYEKCQRILKGDEEVIEKNS